MERAATELSHAYEALCRDYLGPVESPYLNLEVRRHEHANHLYHVDFEIRHTHYWVRHELRPIYNPTLLEYTALPGHLEDMDQARRRPEPPSAGDPRHGTSKVTFKREGHLDVAALNALQDKPLKSV